MTSKNLMVLITFILISLPTITLADDAVINTIANKNTHDAMIESLAKILPGRQPDSIEATAIPDLFEVMIGSDIFYVTADGKHLLQGDLYELASKTNLTEAKRSIGRLNVMASIDPATMITFKPKKTLNVVNVFTDIDCGYCRKLHSEIDSYLAKGIEIRYIAFPRSGYRTRSYFKAVAAWCADDPKDALTRSKAGQEIEQKTCDNPVDQHLAAAHELGLSGTPTLVFEDGTILPGYVPADQLGQILNNQ